MSLPEGTSVHICTHCNRKRSPIATEFVQRTLWFQNVRFGSKTYDLAPKQTFLAPKNSSREDTPEHASAAWDHWTGRDCAAGRPSRSLCLDLTSGPPLDAPASHSHPTPPEHGHRFMYRAVPECTWVWILTRQGTGSRGTTAPAAPRRWVHRSRRGPPSKPVRLQREFCAHQPGHPPAGVRAGYRHSSRTVRWQTASCQDRTTLPVVGGVGRGNTPSPRRQLQCGCCGGHRLRTKHLSQYHAPAGTAGRLTQRRCAACGQDSQQSKSPRCTPLSQT